jgi:hypothetical protein
VSGDAVLTAVRDASAECVRELLHQQPQPPSRPQQQPEQPGQAEREEQREQLASGRNLHVLGLDIMLDAAGRPWLIEANHAPFMRLKTDATARALVVDMVFPSKLMRFSIGKCGMYPCMLADAFSLDCLLGQVQLALKAKFA